MAEFCYKCFCEFWGVYPNESELVFTKELDLCEGCGNYKKTVVAYKKDFFIYRLRRLITATKIISAILLLPFYPIIYFSKKLPHRKRNKSKRKKDF